MYGTIDRDSGCLRSQLFNIALNTIDPDMHLQILKRESTVRLMKLLVSRQSCHSQ